MLQPVFSINASKSKHLRKYLAAFADDALVGPDERRAIARLLIVSTSFAVYNLAEFTRVFENNIVHCEQFFAVGSLEQAYEGRVNGASLAHYIKYLEQHGKFPAPRSLGYVRADVHT